MVKKGFMLSVEDPVYYLSATEKTCEEQGKNKILHLLSKLSKVI